MFIHSLEEYYGKNGIIGNQDIGCINICAAINRVSGVETVWSCCGHENKPMRVIFRAKDFKSMTAIVIAVNRFNSEQSKKFYDKFKDVVPNVDNKDFLPWFIFAEYDVNDYVHLSVNSGLNNTSSKYDDADRIADLIDNENNKD